MIEDDPNVRVSVTGPEEDFCIQIEAYDLIMNLHTRSAVDLHYKLGIALCDWMRDTGRAILVREFHQHL